MTLACLLLSSVGGTGWGCLREKGGEGFLFISNKMFHLLTICVDKPVSWGSGPADTTEFMGPPARQLKTFLLDLKFLGENCVEFNTEF